MKTPLWDALNEHVAAQRSSFHTPGHKSGRILSPALKEAWGEAVFHYDLTEVRNLDVLQQADGVLKESQEAAAAAYGVSFARYLTGGATLGLMAAVDALCHQKKVFLPRNAHQSLYHALMLAEAEPIYLMPELDEQSVLPKGIDVATFKAAMEETPDAHCLVLVDPDYYGRRGEHEKILALAKEAGLTVIVDAAHGAHFGWIDEMPDLLIGDITVVSAHKTLSTLTGGAVLLGNSPNFTDAIDGALRIYASSSPSYLILASIEAGIALMDSPAGKLMMRQGLKQLAQMRAKLRALTPVIDLNSDGCIDPYRWYLRSNRCSGEALAEALQQRKIDVELSQGDGCLLILPLDGHCQKLLIALKDIEKSLKKMPLLKKMHHVKISHLPEKVYTMAVARRLSYEMRPLSRCLGAVCQENITPYPPGIPLIVSGERIDLSVIDAARMAGYSDQQLIRIVKEDANVCRYSRTGARSTTTYEDNGTTTP